MYTPTTNQSYDLDLDSQSKQWRGTAIRARAQRQGPLIGAVSLLIVVVICIMGAGNMDAKNEEALNQLRRPLRGLEEKHKEVSDKLDAAFQALENAQNALSHHQAASYDHSKLDQENAAAITSAETSSGYEHSSKSVDNASSKGEEEETETRTERGLVVNENTHPTLPLKQVDRSNMNPRQAEVLKAIEYAWDAYKSNAWGRDELLPLSRSGRDWCELGLTMVDSLDLLWLIHDDQSFNEVVDWIELNFDPRGDVSINMFEVTIRVLGGLLSGYFMSNNEVLLNRAISLGNSLSAGFDTKSGIPFSDVNLMESRGFNPHNGPSSLAEAGSLQLEFSYLAKISFSDELRRKVQRSNEALRNAATMLNDEMSGYNLLPLLLNPHSGKFGGGARDEVSLGARGDSYYEYLLKQWLLSDRKDARFLDDYRTSIEGIKKFLVAKANGYTYIGEKTSSHALSPKMDHLVCFLPGTLALGHSMGADESNHEHLELAVELLETCLKGYETPSGLPPEIWWFRDTDGPYIKSADAFSLLRPETVESLFYLWKITGEERWREAGWGIFNRMNEVAKVPTSEGVGFSSMSNVNRADGGERRDSMESFFIAETLKYLFLLFDDQGLVELDKVVFNTEAHPFPVFNW